LEGRIFEVPYCFYCIVFAVPTWTPWGLERRRHGIFWPITSQGTRPGKHHENLLSNEAGFGANHWGLGETMARKEQDRMSNIKIIKPEAAETKLGTILSLVAMPGLVWGRVGLEVRRRLSFRRYDLQSLAVLINDSLCRKGMGVTANCLHPGFVATRFGDQSGGVISRARQALRDFLRKRKQ
jgi:hypothetical protein